MRSRLLLAVAAVLFLGTLIDATVHRESVSLRVCCTFPDVARPPLGERVVPTLVTHAISADTVWVQLRHYAPGATLFVEESNEFLDPLFLRTIAAVADIRTVGRIEFNPSIEPVSIDVRGGLWAIYVAPGPVAAMVVADRDGVSNFVDVRLLDAPSLPVVLAPAPEGGVTYSRPPGDPPSMLRAVVVDAAVLIGFLLLGGGLLPQTFGQRAIRHSLAPFVGLALHATLGLLLLPGPYGLVTTALVAVVVGGALRAAGIAVGWRVSDLPGLIGVSALVVSTVSASRLFELLFRTRDSADYWAGAAALADGTLLPESLSAKRGLAQQAIHAPGFVLGVDGLLSIGPVVFVLCLLLLVQVGRFVVKPQRTRLVILFLTIAAFALSRPIHVFAEYLNSHLLFSAFLVALIVLLGRIGSTESPKPWNSSEQLDPGPAQSWSLLPAVAAVTGVLVLLRPEGPLIVGLVLLGSLVSLGYERPGLSAAREPLRLAWAALGAITLLWVARLSQGTAIGGRFITLETALLGVIALVAVFVALTLSRIPSAAIRRGPHVVGILLWSVALVLLRNENVAFLDSARANLGHGYGGWGASGPLLLIVGLVGVTLTSRLHRSSELWVDAARWALIGLVPVHLFAKLGDGIERGQGIETLLSGGGRVGPLDSINRMWAHAVPLVLLLLVASACRENESATCAVAGRRRRSVIPGALLILLAGGWVAIQWQPVYLPTSGPSESTRVLSLSGVEPVAQLVDGVSVSQGVSIPRPALTPGARPERVCVGVRFATLDRQTFGTYSLELQAGGAETVRTIDGRRVEDWSFEEVCLDVALESTDDDEVGRLEEMLSQMRVTVRGGGTSAGPAAVVLQGPGAAIGAVVTQTDVDGRESQRRVDPLAMTVDVYSELPTPRLWGIADAVVPLLPWAAVVFGVGAALAPVGGRGRR